jgi:hypothetical protein
MSLPSHTFSLPSQIFLSVTNSKMFFVYYICNYATNVDSLPGQRWLWTLMTLYNNGLYLRLMIDNEIKCISRVFAHFCMINMTQFIWGLKLEGLKNKISTFNKTLWGLSGHQLLILYVITFVVLYFIINHQPWI